MLNRPRLAITCGEPGGIGPDVLIQLIQSPLSFTPVVIADRNLLQQRARLLGYPLQLIAFAPQQSSILQPSQLLIQHVPMPHPCQPGVADPANANYVLQTLEQAVVFCEQNICAAMVTGPVNKHSINQAKISFSGHTEWLGKRFHVTDPTMFFVTKPMKLALVTTHIPLAQVPAAITPARLQLTLERVHHALKNQFGINDPHIFVAGLNPHAGESGDLGQEELRVMLPVIRSLQQQGMRITDPMPADTLFSQHNLTQSDAFVTMYHDQGLPVLKTLAFGDSVNITLGLPIIRTSVDHGTALALAGSGKSDPSSLRAACELAQQLATVTTTHAPT